VASKRKVVVGERQREGMGVNVGIRRVEGWGEGREEWGSLTINEIYRQLNAQEATK
jgi:hypothetical protein